MSDEIQKYLYAITWPNYALVASMLTPREFGRHYAIGSSRYCASTIVFAEIDREFRHPFFKIDELLEDVKPAPDGTPKRTKFIASYRVLEHLEFSALRNLYVASVEGEVLELRRGLYEPEPGPEVIRTFQEICPFSAIVMSYKTPVEFGAYITDPGQPKSAPKVMFTEISLPIDDFLRQLEANPFAASPIPNVHPHKLREQILDLRANPGKQVKGVSLDSAFDRLPFLKLEGGFWFAGGGELVFYPIPDADTLERDYFEFFHSVKS